MKRIEINFIGHGTGANMIEINGNKSMITSNYQLLSKVYNEINHSDFTFFDIVKKYVKSMTDEELKKLEIFIHNKFVNGGSI